MDDKQRARELRQRATPAEELLWAQLRNRRLGGHKFRRQHPIGHYIADFVCLERRLVVEADGASHDDPAGRDAARDTWLARAGYRVIRVPNDEVHRNLDGVLQTILNAITEASPHPDPLPRSGERETQ